MWSGILVRWRVLRQFVPSRLDIVMSTPTPLPANLVLQPIAQVFEQNLSIRLVYGEPIRQGERTVIPMAKVAFGFGAGSGRRPLGRGRQESAASEVSATDLVPEGAGGGGGARLTPVGALEIGPHGTRFVRYLRLPQLLAPMAIGFGAALLLARRRH
jgi:uncharacterized spore protein YtfJ